MFNQKFVFYIVNLDIVSFVGHGVPFECFCL